MAGHIAYEERFESRTGASPSVRSVKCAFDYAKNFYREENTSWDPPSKVQTIVASGTEQRTANDDGLTDIRFAPPKVNPLGRLENILRLSGGPNLWLGRGLSGLKNLRQIEESGKPVLVGDLPDRTEIKAYGAEAAHHWLPTQIVRSEPNGAIIGEYNFSGIILNDGDRSVPETCVCTSRMSDGTLVGTITCRVVSADFLVPEPSEFALTWDKDKQFNDFRVDPPRFYHTQELVGVDGKALSLEAILLRSQKENESVNKVQTAHLAQIHAQEERLKWTAVIGSLLLLALTGAIRKYWRKKAA